MLQNKRMSCVFQLSPEEEAFLTRLVNDRQMFDFDDREVRRSLAMQYLMKLALAAAMSVEAEQHAAQAGQPDWLEGVVA